MAKVHKPFVHRHVREDYQPNSVDEHPSLAVAAREINEELIKPAFETWGILMYSLQRRAASEVH